MRKMLILFFLLFAAAAFSADQDLGSIDFPTSASPEAQAKFLRGVLFLHSFEYEDARTLFQEAQKIDPDFALAYWGEAMTWNHPVWNDRYRDSAVTALKKLGPDAEARIAKAKTEREKAYLKAVEILFEDGEKKARDLAYLDAMKQVYEKYPDDLEAASFYALALLGSCQDERDIPTYMKAAAVVEEVFAKNPNHPGAVHYLIHSYDDPVHAPLGLRAARVYAKIAPAAVHALHMPSHIFLAMGMWDDVQSSNQASWDASKHTSYHALHWLQYSYLQQGRREDAKKLLAIMEADAKKQTERSAWHLSAMRAGYVVETGEPHPVKVEELKVRSGYDLSVSVADLYAAGSSALKAGNVSDAEKALSKIRTAYGGPVTKSDGAMQCSAHASGASQSDLIAVEVMGKELEAQILMAKGKKEEAIQLVKQAAADEERMSFGFGPPIPVKPAYELLGEMLIQTGRYGEARTAFEKSLLRAPRRQISEKGLAEAGSKAATKAP